MIVKTTAIPLAYFPYSSTSRVVHWLTRQQGKISTLLKGALRPKNPFSGGYSLFSTSELLFQGRRTAGLYTGTECSLLTERPQFRTDWRAMMAASRITALFAQTTPDHAPQPELFEFYEELLDQAIEFGSHPAFTFWAELKFCDWHGHAPHLTNCIHCASEKHLCFSAAHGGTVCRTCARTKKIPFLECSLDVLTSLRELQQNNPHSTKTIQHTPQQAAMIHDILTNFIINQLDIRLSIRHKSSFQTSF